MGLDWSHAGVAQLLSNINANGYKIMFLSSRAIAQASHTRDYLHHLTQDGHKLPVGPVVISPDGLIPSLYREMVVRRPHEFKIATLQSIRNLFPPAWNPFYAGFGNRGTDELSYKAVGIPAGKIFTINPRGEIRRSTGVVVGSLLASLGGINALVNEVFPPQGISTGESARAEFNDMAFWRPPILGGQMIDSDEEPDLAPPIGKSLKSSSWPRKQN
jgi:phosphatidate phosphatase LPIN